ncbi:hypothetical protein OAA96_00980 [Polaribacter sp.]|nr:hypothetical protein [Polaribacter sp.]
MTNEEIKNLGNIVFDVRDISPTQLGITSRKINYWLDHNLVPFVEKHQNVKNTETISKEAATKTKWIRLNLSQAVWVCIIDTLSSFGVSADKIYTLGKSIWHEPRVDKYADKVFKEHIKNNKHQLPKDVIESLKQIVADEYWMKDFRKLINPFTDMLKSAILRESMPHTLLYVPGTNDFEFLYGDMNLTLKLSSVYTQHPMISIPMIPILAKVLAVDFGNKKKELSYLSEIEKQIRDIVVFKKPKIVEIAFENENIKPIVVTEQHKTREQLARYILEHKIAKGAKLLIDIRAQGNYKLTLIKN